MIKVLVVDDENLVRKGFVSIMPWIKYGMEVIGDVNSGENALEFLKLQQAELVITDLLMPGMSGLELMKSIQALYPGIWIVVLTFHQDFEYVREALRIGAIDYILKTQLDKDQLDDVLYKIYGRISYEQEKQKSKELHGMGGISPSDWGIALISIQKIQNSCLPDDVLPDMQGLDRRNSIRIDECMWLYVLPDKASYDAAGQFTSGMDRSRWIALGIEGLKDKKPEDIRQALHAYREHDLFYDYQTGRNMVEISWNGLLKKENTCSSEDIVALREIWYSMHWLFEEEALARLFSETERLCLDTATLEGIIYSAMKEWESCLGSMGVKMPAKTGKSFIYWAQWIDWLMNVRKAVQEQTSAAPYSKEVIESIAKAIKYIHSSNDPTVREEDAARYANMSRSYFSCCFKGITGKTFSAFMMNLRISMAEFMLLNTDKPVYWIAEKAGYQSEKHFSRMFNKYKGMLPSEFRNKGR